MIGKNLKQIRELLGLSQIELAQKLQMTPSAISQIEHNKRNPSYSTIRKIIKKLNLNPTALFPKE